MSTRRTRVFPTIALLIGVATTLVAAASASTKAEDPIVIGAAVAQTGVMSQFDIPEIQGLQLGIAEINKSGGILGRPLKLVISDHKSNLNQVQQSALSVIGKGADVVVTTHDFDFGGPAARAAQSKGLLALGGAGGMGYGRVGIGPLAFNMYPGNVTEGANMAQFAYNKGFRRPFLFQDLSILYTKEVCSFFEKQWQAIGGASLAGKTTFQNSDTSFASQVSQVRQSKADSVIICSYPPGGPAVIRQLRAGGVNLPVVASGGGMDGTGWLNAVPNLSNYYDVVMASLTGDDPRPKVNQLFRFIKQQTGKPAQLSAQALTGYAITQVLKRAITQAKGSTDGKTLAQIIEKYRNVNLIIGPATYSANCHIPVGLPMQIRQVKNGKSSWLQTVRVKSVPKSPC